MEVKFTVAGGFNLDDALEKIHASSGDIVAILLPDGRKARLCVALEVESKDETTHQYITDVSEMEALGFRELDYGDLFFVDPEEQAWLAEMATEAETEANAQNA